MVIGSSTETFPSQMLGVFGDIFPSQPWLYLVFLVVLAGVFGAAYATFGLAVSTWVNNPYITIATPFAFLVVAGYMAERSLKLAVIGHPAGTFLPFRYGMSGMQIIIQYLLLAVAFLVSFIFYARRARNQRLA